MKKKLEYKFTMCENLTPCPHLNPEGDAAKTMIGEYECTKECPYHKGHECTKEYYGRYSRVGEGYVICDHPNNELDYTALVGNSEIVLHGLSYVLLYEGELLLGFINKASADDFVDMMPKNKYHRMSNLKVSIKIKEQ